MARDGPECGREVLFPANPDLADIMGKMDLDFENLHFGDFLDSKFPDFQVPRFRKSGLGLGLGPDSPSGAQWDGSLGRPSGGPQEIMIPARGPQTK